MSLSCRMVFIVLLMWVPALLSVAGAVGEEMAAKFTVENSAPGILNYTVVYGHWLVFYVFDANGVDDIARYAVVCDDKEIPPNNQTVHGCCVLRVVVGYEYASCSRIEIVVEDKQGAEAREIIKVGPARDAATRFINRVVYASVGAMLATLVIVSGVIVSRIF